MSEVLLSIEGGVATLSLNRPGKLNAMNEAMGDALSAHVERLKADEDLRVVILTGAGRAFSAGGDLDMLSGFNALSIDAATDVMLAFYKRFLCIRDIPVPVIAAVGGAAVGAGVCLTLACDVRIAREDARLAMNFTRLGLHPGCGATFFLPRVVGEARARQILMTGRTFSGAEAAAIGLVHQAVPADAFQAAVAAAAAELAQAGPLASRQLKQGMRAWLDEGALSRALAWEARCQATCYQTADFQEGIAAARERRPPRFTFS